MGHLAELYSVLKARPKSLITPISAFLSYSRVSRRSLHLFQHDSLGVRGPLEGLLPLIPQMRLLVVLVCPELRSAVVLELTASSNAARLTARHTRDAHLDPISIMYQRFLLENMPQRAHRSSLHDSSLGE